MPSPCSTPPNVPCWATSTTRLTAFQGVNSQFFRRDGKFFIRTDGPDGQLADFEVKYTFGIAPLQQYLVELPGGRLQAASVTWDARPREQGGQRWFRQYPDEKVDHTDELHWTRRAQNWNFMCADCHSTQVSKGYDAADDSFKTTYAEISVGCEACHGPGSAHVQWAERKGNEPDKGLTVQFDERRGVAWTRNEAGKPVRSDPRQTEREIEVCAQCHARRAQIAEGYQPGSPVPRSLPAFIADTHAVSRRWAAAGRGVHLGLVAAESHARRRRHVQRLSRSAHAENARSGQRGLRAVPRTVEIRRGHAPPSRAGHRRRAVRQLPHAAEHVHGRGSAARSQHACAAAR